jgi:hypothetical protein
MQGKRSDRINFWKNHIHEWKKSGLSQTVYSRQAGIDQGLFSKWKIRLLKKDNNQGQKLVELKPYSNLYSGLSHNQNPFEIILPNGATIRIGQSISMAMISEIIKTVQTV